MKGPAGGGGVEGALAARSPLHKDTGRASIRGEERSVVIREASLALPKLPPTPENSHNEWTDRGAQVIGIEKWVDVTRQEAE